MHTVLISLVEKLPAGYLMALLPVCLVSGIWLFTHIRRDKQGKMYFYSQKYEDLKRNRKQDAIRTSSNCRYARWISRKRQSGSPIVSIKDWGTTHG
jgi:hypothetical protein